MTLSISHCELSSQNASDIVSYRDGRGFEGGVVILEMVSEDGDFIFAGAIVSPIPATRRDKSFM
jgi:hypothetical protein